MTDIENTGDAFLREFSAKAARARVPLSGSIELTHRCNLKCIHCYLGDQTAIRQHRKREMSTADVKRILDEVVAAGTLNTTFTGGDPMVRKYFGELYTYAVRKGLMTTVFCDGVLITDKIIDVFNRYPPRMVEISLYGASKETYERITQVPGSFEKCLRGIARLHEHGHRFTLKSVLMTANRHELSDMQAIADDYGVRFYWDFAIFPCLPHGDNAGLSNQPKLPATASVEVAPPTISRYRQRASEKHDLNSPLALRLEPRDVADATVSSPQLVDQYVGAYIKHKDFPGNDRLYKCGAALTTFHVDPFGNIQACTISTNTDYNLLEGSFSDAWNGPLKALRELKARPELSCNSCNLNAICMGCPAMFQSESGALDQKSDYLCETTHRIFAQIAPMVERKIPEQSYV